MLRASEEPALLEASVEEASPTVGELNTLTVKFVSNAELPAGTNVTVSGLDSAGDTPIDKLDLTGHQRHNFRVLVCIQEFQENLNPQFLICIPCPEFLICIPYPQFWICIPCPEFLICILIHNA